MKGLPYLVALLLLVPLLVVAPSAGAQEEDFDDSSEDTRGDVSSSIVISGNGSAVTDSFDLEPGLAIVVVCTGGGDATADDENGEDADPDTGTDDGDEVDAGPGEAVARAGGVVARAGGDGDDGGGDGEGQASETSSSEQTESRSDVDCEVTNRGEGNSTEANCITTEQGDIECVENETGTGNSDVSVGLLDEDGGATRIGEDPDDPTGSANRTRLMTSSSQAAGTDGGRHQLAVRAKGPWTVRVEQPRPADAPRKVSFSGDRETATGFFRMSRGTKDFEMTHRGEGRFTVRLLDENGAKVGKSLAKKKGPFRGSTSVGVPRDGIYLLQVDADGPWSVRAR